MAERKTGAGMQLSGVLERAQRPESAPAPEAEEAEPASRGRGPGPSPKAGKPAPARAAKRVKGRTVYIADDLYERIIVQAHRKDLTHSDYICLLLDRHVPDHRVIRSGAAAAAPDPVEPELT